MRKRQMLMIMMITLATLIAINGQRLAYYLAGTIAPLRPVVYLTFLTFLSILLFLTTPVMVYQHNQNNKEKQFALTVIINFIISIPVTLWSLFVLVMWWG